jgi:RNase P subunit RPR2
MAVRSAFVNAAAASARVASSFSAKDVEDALRLGEKVRRRCHDEAPRMTCPDVDQPLVNRSSLGRGLHAKRILVVVPALKAWRAQMDHRVVSAELLVERGSNGAP